MSSLLGVGGGKARLNRMNKIAARIGVRDERERNRMKNKIRRDIAYDKRRVRA